MAGFQPQAHAVAYPGIPGGRIGDFCGIVLAKLVFSVAPGASSVVLCDGCSRPFRSKDAILGSGAARVFLLPGQCCDLPCRMEVCYGSSNDHLATLSTLTGDMLPPVGQRVIWWVRGSAPPVFPEYEAVWLNSGTSALSLAISVAMNRRPEVTSPVVLIPAYACPDLVSAALLAGARPILIDTGGSDPALDQASLTERWTSDVVAVVAVNFLGIRERIRTLAALTASRDAMLIEDCAQWFPEGSLSTETAVLSFGRGKPVNLLGGGALLVRKGARAKLPRLGRSRPEAALWAKAMIFNLSLTRWLYGWVTRLPGVRVGETIYRSVADPHEMDEKRLALANPNIQRWVQRIRWREDMFQEHLAKFSDITRLPDSLAPRSGRLLRFPILVPTRERRDAALALLDASGLGATSFYRRPLPEVENIPSSVARQGPFAGASRFADRLITLPLHDGVTRHDITRIVAGLGRIFS